MKSIKEKAFEQALYHLDERNRLKKELGEFDRMTCIQQAKYSALKELIFESGYGSEWDQFLSDVFDKRMKAKELGI